MASPSEAESLGLWEKWTSHIMEHPYSIFAYLKRAKTLKDLEFPDLAASDAYKALLLTDEVDGGEWEEEVLQTLRLASEQDLEDGQTTDSSFEKVAEQAQSMAKEAYAILIQALINCGDLVNASVFAHRACMAFAEDELLKALHKSVSDLQAKQMIRSHETDGPKTVSGKSLDGPAVRREVYAWNLHEPDRLSDSVLTALNAELERWAPKLEIRAVELPALGPNDAPRIWSSSSSISKQLGIFAKEELQPGETILREPSILTANNRLLEPVCDACGAPLPDLVPSSESITCSECIDVCFCSTTCHERALESYHQAVCGIEDYDVVVKDPDAATATDSLYLLLVIRAIAMAETQDVHPLDLTQVKYLWGDFNPTGSTSRRTLPFDFSKHVAQPIHIMLNMGLDPFLPTNFQRYDTWVLNTLFAKFRGVASAKLNVRTLKPDVAAVHPLWCLANHSCAPNVKWSWGAEGQESEEGEKGAMGFIVRGGEDVVQWGNVERRGGIPRGAEILNHYCDIGMNVQERREWAVGALGGVCICERCLHEEQDQFGCTSGNAARPQDDNEV